jgi:hypothetical protein
VKVSVFFAVRSDCLNIKTSLSCKELKVTLLVLKKQHRLRVFENRVLRRKFGLKRDEVREKWRKLHSGELHNLRSTPDIIR